MVSVFFKNHSHRVFPLCTQGLKSKFSEEKDTHFEKMDIFSILILEIKLKLNRGNYFFPGCFFFNFCVLVLLLLFFTEN